MKKIILRTPRTGIDFDLLNPESSLLGADVGIDEREFVEEIAHSLSQLCRFRGHTSQFLSVAAHSVGVEAIVSRINTNPLVGFAALTHDIAEIFFSDIPAPLKDELKVSTSESSQLSVAEVEERVLTAMQTFCLGRWGVLGGNQNQSSITLHVAGVLGSASVFVDLADRVARQLEGNLLYREPFVGFSAYKDDAYTNKVLFDDACLRYLQLDEKHEAEQAFLNRYWALSRSVVAYVHKFNESQKPQEETL